VTTKSRTGAYCAGVDIAGVAGQGSPLLARRRSQILPVQSELDVTMKPESGLIAQALTPPGVAGQGSALPACRPSQILKVSSAPLSNSP